MSELLEKTAKSTKSRGGRKTTQDRMTMQERRDFIMDIALEILREEGAGAVNIGEVATRGQVTRTLIYKHFANRKDLISGVYRREAGKLHEVFAELINSSEGFENKMRVFITAVLEAIDSHGWMFGQTEPQTHEEGFLADQRQRNIKTVRYFAQLASDEFGISLKESSSAMGILLSGISSFRIQAGLLKSTQERLFLADLYLNIVMSAIMGLPGYKNNGSLVRASSAENNSF